jgi:hypothetical protein
VSYFYSGAQGRFGVGWDRFYTRVGDVFTEVGSKLDHACFGIVRGRVYSRVGGVLLTQRDVSKLVHRCFRIDR